MLSKASVTKQIENLPENFTLDELIERLIVIEKVDQAMLELQAGKTITDVELDQIMEKWFV